jgi:hypothetical protein
MEILFDIINLSLKVLLVASGMCLPVAEIIYLLVKKKNKLFIKEWVSSAVRIIRIAGLFYLITLMMSYISAPDQSIDQEYESYSLLNRIFGPGWFFFWIPVICISLIPQLLWFTSIKNSRFLRMMISLILYLGGTENFNFLITFLNRDYLPSSWNFSFQHNLAEVILMIFLFSGAGLTDIFIVRKIRFKKNKN